MRAAPRELAALLVSIIPQTMVNGTPGYLESAQKGTLPLLQIATSAGPAPTIPNKRIKDLKIDRSSRGLGLRYKRTTVIGQQLARVPRSSGQDQRDMREAPSVPAPGTPQSQRREHCHGSSSYSFQPRDNG